MKKEHIDVSKLAEEPELQDYQHKPVQNFGMSLLKSMGYNAERGIGKSNKNQLTDILVLKPRPRGQGLGAQSLQQPVVQKLQVGDKVLITAQTHKGLTGLVNQILKDDFLSIQLHPSKAIVKIQAKGVKKISKAEMKKIQQQANKQQPEEKKKKRLKWVVPQIRVKIIDSKSEHYLKKVVVTELISQRIFECRDQAGKVMTNFSEKDIQTVIPKSGKTVLIVRGQHKGAKATLIDRNKSKQSVTVQNLQQLQMLKLQENDVSQYLQF